MIDISSDCDVGCESCFKSHSKKTISKVLLSRLVNYIENNLPTGIFVGGEPMNSLDLITDLIRDKPDTHFVIITNGETLTKERVQQIKQVGNLFVVVSLNGIGHINDLSRRNGSFFRVMKGIELLREEIVPFGISTVANSYNIEQIISHELARFVNKVGACTWEIIRYYPIGPDEEKFSKLILKPEEQIQLHQYRRALSKCNPFNFIFSFLEHENRKCMRNFNVDSDGHMSYCPFAAWGLAKIEPNDSDDEIDMKFRLKQKEWEELTEATSE